jgi:hypothetical protein
MEYNLKAFGATELSLWVLSIGFLLFSGHSKTCDNVRLDSPSHIFIAMSIS